LPVIGFTDAQQYRVGFMTFADIAHLQTAANTVCSRTKAVI
jgi:hypothetical protein